MQSMSPTLNARALVADLSPAELDALRNVAVGGSLRDLARILSTDVTGAAQVINSMKLKLGAARNADAVRVAIRAELGD
jgi:DNA-binding CsgD family transcriptional regulator